MIASELMPLLVFLLAFCVLAALTIVIGADIATLTKSLRAIFYNML